MSDSLEIIVVLFLSQFILYVYIVNGETRVCERAFATLCFSLLAPSALCLSHKRPNDKKAWGNTRDLSAVKAQIKGFQFLNIQI